MELKPGTRFRSQVCETEVVVVKVGSGGELTCGGVPVVPIDAAVDGSAPMDAGLDGGTLLGKRYVDEASGVEILCVKPGCRLARRRRRVCSSSRRRRRCPPRTDRSPDRPGGRIRAPT